jgi:hypothetical protein
MSRKELPLIREKIVPFDLEAFVHQATALNQRNAEMVTTPFPKAPHRWLSHYQCTPRPITFTAEGEVEGGLSGLLGAVIDFPSASPGLSVPPRIPLKVATATTQPASASSRWLSK